jgi:hypothetical protein
MGSNSPSPGNCLIRWKVSASEERYLIGKFGQDELYYQIKVRRWL